MEKYASAKRYHVGSIPTRPSMKDALGKTINVGDNIVYFKGGSGNGKVRSVVGTVVSTGEKSCKIDLGLGPNPSPAALRFMGIYSNINKDGTYTVTQKHRTVVLGDGGGTVVHVDDTLFKQTILELWYWFIEENLHSESLDYAIASKKISDYVSPAIADYISSLITEDDIKEYFDGI